MRFHPLKVPSDFSLRTCHIVESSELAPLGAQSRCIAMGVFVRTTSPSSGAEGIETSSVLTTVMARATAFVSPPSLINAALKTTSPTASLVSIPSTVADTESKSVTDHSPRSPDDKTLSEPETHET